MYSGSRHIGVNRSCIVGFGHPMPSNEGVIGSRLLLYYMSKSYYKIHIYYSIESDDALNRALENLRTLDVTIENEPLSQSKYEVLAFLYKRKYNVTLNKRHEMNVIMRLNKLVPQESSQNVHDKIAIEKLIEKCLAWFGDDAEVRFIYYKYIDPSLDFQPINLNGFINYDIAIGKSGSCSYGVAVKGILWTMGPGIIMDVLKELGCHEVCLLENHSESESHGFWDKPLDWYRIGFKKRILWPSELYAPIREACSKHEVDVKATCFGIRLFEDCNDPYFESFPDTPGFYYYRKKKS